LDISGGGVKTVEKLLIHMTGLENSAHLPGDVVEFLKSLYK
jgi:hypothetical protein